MAQVSVAQLLNVGVSSEDHVMVGNIIYEILPGSQVLVIVGDNKEIYVNPSWRCLRHSAKLAFR